MNNSMTNARQPYTENATSDEFAPAAFNMEYYRRTLWDARKRISIAVCVSIVLGIIALQIIPFKYTATVVVRPPDTNNSLGSLSSSLSSLSGLGGIAAMFATADSSDYDAYNALLDSDALSNRIAQKHPDLMHSMFSSYWNSDTKKWDDTTPINFLKNIIKISLGFQPWQIPNGEDVKLYLEKEVDISNDIKTNMTTISYDDPDPVFAKNLVDAMFREADSIVREQARQRSIKRIAYLEKLLPTVTESDQHAALIQLLTSEEQKLMMVQADEFYAATPVDLPIVSARPTFPPQILLLIGLAILGFGVEYARALYIPKMSVTGWLKARFSRKRGGMVATQPSRAG